MQTSTHINPLGALGMLNFVLHWITAYHNFDVGPSGLCLAILQVRHKVGPRPRQFRLR